MSQVIDARGKACPQPVLMTKKAIEVMEKGTVTVVVDSAISRDNVVRFATSQGCETRVEEKGEEFHVDVVKGRAAGAEVAVQKPSGEGAGEKNITVYIHSNRMGQGDDALGAILIKGFLKALKVVFDTVPVPKQVSSDCGMAILTVSTETHRVKQALLKRGIAIKGMYLKTASGYEEQKDG